MKRHVHQLLSAYIDGEAPCPDQIEAHLRQCDDCARHHRELLRVSQRMQALPFPEVRPEFATRVMAHVRETDRAPARNNRPWLVAAFGAPILAVFAVAWLFQLNAQRNPFNATVTTAPDETFVTSGSAAWPSEDQNHPDWAVDETIDGDEWPVEIVEPLDSAWDTPLVEAWGPPEDLDGLLLRLDEKEEEDFRALLWLYAQETDVI